MSSQALQPISVEELVEIVREGHAAVNNKAAAAPLSFGLMARSGERANYEVPVGTPIYRDRCLCRVGKWHIADGTLWTATRELFDDFAANYDPHWCVAQVNFDHDAYEGGPVQGVILNCRRVDDELRGDVAILDFYAAWQIDQGLWPRVSIEWWQGDIMGEDFYAGDPKHKGVKNYLTGLACLGKYRGAAAGLGPWPKPEYYGIERVDESTPANDGRPYLLPLAAGSDNTRQRALRIISDEEVLTVAHEATAQNPDLAAQQAQANAPNHDLAATQQRNRELEARIAQLEAKSQAEAINSRLQKLQGDGKLNAAQFNKAIENGLFSDVAQRNPRQLLASDGSGATTADRPLIDKLFEVLELAAPQVSLGAQSYDIDPPVQAAAASAFDAALAAKVGLSPEQIAKSRQQLMASGKGGTE